jgi:hypothetical protein
MALGDFMASRQQCAERIVHVQGSDVVSAHVLEGVRTQDGQNMEASTYDITGRHNRNANSSVLPQTVYFLDAHLSAYEASSSAGPAENGLLSKIRMKDRVRVFPISNCFFSIFFPNVFYKVLKIKQ